ncbi:MAG: hypothetical protein KJ655_01790 [Candidatus Thermoplasmatota archaeon]|nr:hypothetical protein [Candidatus Thermoplasmatota archaeon]
MTGKLDSDGLIDDLIILLDHILDTTKEILWILGHLVNVEKELLER